MVLKEGDKVIAPFEGQGRYAGRIVAINKASVAIEFDDGDYDANVPKNTVELLLGDATENEVIIPSNDLKKVPKGNKRRRSLASASITYRVGDADERITSKVDKRKGDGKKRRSSASHSITTNGAKNTSVESGLCCGCGKAYTGSHSCRECGKPCHAICGTPVGEGFGAKVVCYACGARKGKAKDAVKKGKAKDTHTSLSLVALNELRMKSYVAFVPENESFCRNKKGVGVFDIFKEQRSVHIIGVAHETKRKQYQVMWVDSRFQSHQPKIDCVTFQRGVAQYSTLKSRLDVYDALSNSGPVHHGVNVNVEETSDWDEDSDAEYDFAQIFSDREQLNSTLEDVESYQNMTFVENAYQHEAVDVFRQEGVTITAQTSPDHSKSTVRPEYRDVLNYSPASAFFVFLPLEFWQGVERETNRYRELHKLKGSAICLDEILLFIGLMFHMKLADKGEYANYWGEQHDLSISNGSSSGYDRFMSLNRFKFIRRCFCVKAIDEGITSTDPLVRLRPLVNMLRTTSQVKYQSKTLNATL